MVTDHSDSERGNPLPPHWLLFPINSNGSFICTFHRQDSTYHGLCGALAGTKNSSMGPPHEGSIRRPIAPWANALTTELHLSPVYNKTAYMVKDQTDLENETSFPHMMCNSFWKAARDLLYVLCHRQDSTYHFFLFNQSWYTGWNGKKA